MHQKVEELREIAAYIRSNSNTEAIANELDNVADTLVANMRENGYVGYCLPISKISALIMLVMHVVPSGVDVMCGEYGEPMYDESDEESDCEHDGQWFESVEAEHLETLADDEYKTFQLWF